MRAIVSYGMSRGAAKRFNEREQSLKREGENSSDRRARMDNLLAAKRATRRCSGQGRGGYGGTSDGVNREVGASSTAGGLYGLPQPNYSIHTRRMERNPMNRTGKMAVQPA